MESNNAQKYQCEQPGPNYLVQQSRHPSASYSQWPRSNQQRLPVSRATSTAGSSGRRLSSPHPRGYPLQRPSLPFSEAVIDPSLDSLSFNTGYSSHVHSSPVSNPLARFYAEAEAPWNPARIYGPSLTVPERTGPPFPSTPDLNYRSGPNSELESHDTAPFTSDSGYGTLDCTTQSVYSMQHADSNQDCSDLHFRVGNMQPFQEGQSEPSESKEMVMKFQSPPVPRKASEKCKYCDATPKCPSDLKKHMLKHEKPFECKYPGCKKKGGFTTINDLKRHEKSVHKIGTSEKSYKCASSQCKNKHKIWPRLDNFKQHIHRMHPKENVEEFVKRSQWDGKQSRSSTPRAASMVPMDTTLAGIDDPSKHVTMSMFHTYGAFSANCDPTTATPQTLEFEDGQNEVGDVPFPYGNGTAAARPGDAPVRSDTVSTASSSGLNALADAAFVSSGVTAPDPSPRPGCSRPQQPSRQKDSESDRQKLALDQLSNVIADGINRSSTSNPKGESLNQTILRILASATGLPLPNKAAGSAQLASGLSGERKGEDLPEKLVPSENPLARDEVAQGFAAIAAALMKKRSKRPHGVVGRQGLSTHPNGKKCPNPNCSLVFNRNCDLKKHLKRHNKPYGCTYPKCNKAFGSKSDWKRHENSQHFQIDTWLCQIAPVSLSEDGSQSASRHCGALYFRQEQFKEHLQKDHTITDSEQIEVELKHRRIGRNGQGRFWCGFCCDIIELKERRTAAWDERFNHIDEHFKNGLNSKQWWCMEAKKTKGEVAKMMNKNNFDDDDEEDEDEDEGFSNANDVVEIDSGSSSESPESHEESSISSPQRGRGRAPASTEQSSVVPTPGAAASHSSRKRRRSPDSSSEGPMKRHQILYCCACTTGPFNRKVFSCCMDCSHVFCPRCIKSTQDLPRNEDLVFKYSGQGHK